MKLEELACPSCGAPLDGDLVPNQKVVCNSCDTPLLLTHLDTDNPLFCPKCNTLNADEIHYCLNCGHNLKIDCISCHTPNRLDTTFCIKCGIHIKSSRKKRRFLQETERLLKKERSEIYKEKQDRQKKEKLQRLLDDLDEPENHEFAIYQINQLGLEAVEALVETLLHDHDPDARYGSARALGQICAERKIKALIKARTAKALIKALTDHEPAVRYWAVTALGKCGSSLAIDPVAKLLKDPHERVQEQARLVLQHIGGERAEEHLKQPPPKKGFLDWLKKS